MDAVTSQMMQYTGYLQNQELCMHRADVISCMRIPVTLFFPNCCRRHLVFDLHAEIDGLRKEELAVAEV
jgi:hypothetical protein